MNKTRDTQRSKLYHAERVVVGKRLETVPEIEGYVTKITRSVWWKKYHKYYSYPIDIKDGRGRRNACAIGTSVVKFPKWSRYEEVVLHELAHLVIASHFGWYEVPAHGAEFAKMLLLMVKRFMGKDEYLKMKESFKENRVHYTTSKV